MLPSDARRSFDYEKCQRRDKALKARLIRTRNPGRKGGGRYDPNLIAAQHVSWMMVLELRARQEEDTGELEAFHRTERLKRERSGYPVAVDLRFRVAQARRCRMPSAVPQSRHRRAPAVRRQAIRQARSRSGRGSPPGDSDESDPDDDDYFPPVAGDTAGAVR